RGSRGPAFGLDDLGAALPLRLGGTRAQRGGGHCHRGRGRGVAGGRNPLLRSPMLLGIVAGRPPCDSDARTAMSRSAFVSATRKESRDGVQRTRQKQTSTASSN